MPKVKAIDFLTFLGISPYGDYYQSAEQLIDLMDINKISQSVIVPFVDTPGSDDDAHQRLIKACNQFPGRFLPFARIDPRYGKRAIKILYKISHLNFMGILFNPVSTDSLPYISGVVSFMEKVALNNLPVIIPSGQAYVGLPEQIALLAEKVPSLKIIIGHMGTSAHAIRAIELLDDHPNLYLETSIQQSPDRITLLSKYIQEGRVVFGSASPYSHPEVELLKIEASRLTDVDKSRLLFHNASVLLNNR
jgi:predicted TIM-barrel fold metal-dependent hydrolase